MALPFAGLGLPEQAMRWIGLGLVVEDKPISDCTKKITNNVIHEKIPYQYYTIF